jgi:hypothetical protein
VGGLAGQHCRVAREGLLSVLEHADSLEHQLERHGPGEPTVRLSLIDDVFLRSDTWARWQLGIPLPVVLAGPSVAMSNAKHADPSRIVIAGRVPTRNKL